MSRHKYYFLISSLPFLRLGEELPIDSRQFLDSCRLHLNREQMGKLENSTVAPDADPSTAVEGKWMAWDTYFRNAVAAERAAKHGGRAEDWQRHENDVFPGILKQVSDAFSSSNPAEREFALDEMRWQKLDELEAERLFEFEALIVYRMRLQIAERWARKDVGAAEHKLKELLETVEHEAGWPATGNEQDQVG